eukprot:3885195-Prymnesium_polylepis.2
MGRSLAGLVAHLAFLPETFFRPAKGMAVPAPPFLNGMGSGAPTMGGVSDLLSRAAWRVTRSPVCSWSDRGRARDRAGLQRVRDNFLPVLAD